MVDSEGAGDRRQLAACVASDFRALVEVLARQAERVDSDGEVSAHIARATAAAERGLHLSEQLLKLTEFADRAETKHQA